MYKLFLFTRSKADFHKFGRKYGSIDLPRYISGKKSSAVIRVRLPSFESQVPIILKEEELLLTCRG